MTAPDSTAVEDLEEWVNANAQTFESIARDSDTSPELVHLAAVFVRAGLTDDQIIADCDALVPRFGAFEPVEAGLRRALPRLHEAIEAPRSAIHRPQVFHSLDGDAIETTMSPYGSVGRLFTGEGLELVWVRKESEEVDPGWFSQKSVDLIVVLRGGLRCEFDDPEAEETNLVPGDVLVLPANTRCRAYRWPRDQREATIFIAVYPMLYRSPP